MKLAIASDYRTSRGDAEPYVRRIGEAGFDCIHWCQEWNTDYLYTEVEVREIKRWIDASSVEIRDMHGSAGVYKSWTAEKEYMRLAGVELVENRIRMLHDLGGSVLVMHIPRRLQYPVDTSAAWDVFRRSMDALVPLLEETGVRLAFENTEHPGSADVILEILQLYPSSVAGLCYDSGHGNISGNGLQLLEEALDRLLCLHLHDNDGTADQHRIPFTGTVDWPRLCGLISRSPYDGSVMLESLMREDPDSEEGFLRRALDAAARLRAMIAEAAGHSM